MAAHPHRIFSKGAEQYAASRPRYPDELFEFLFALCPDHDSAWDCATGSGQAAVALAEKFDKVEATDVSPEQVRSALPHDRVRYSVQPAESTSFADHSFSLITVAQALHWFDLEKFWPEARRVLKRGGIFAAWTYTWPHVSKEIDSVIATKLLEVIKDYWAPQNRLAWDGYAHIAFPFLEVAAPNAKMKHVWSLRRFLAYVGTWSATRRCIDAIGPAFMAEFSEALERAWGTQDEERLVTMDFYCRVGRHV